MRIAILGAGGVGGYYGGLLARSNHSVHLLARGENLSILLERGLEVRTPEESFLVPVGATDDVKQFGPIDWAIVAVKAYSLGEIGPAAKSLAQKWSLDSSPTEWCKYSRPFSGMRRSKRKRPWWSHDHQRRANPSGSFRSPRHGATGRAG